MPIQFFSHQVFGQIPDHQTSRKCGTATIERCVEIDRRSWAVMKDMEVVFFPGTTSGASII
ncbi:Tissue alpha-L-fucosidase [Gossypium arboreum]|uniref:Tissue alpha-L-fucosidase n=1 Tax=Gossypium arboreum TaxID=29729 RepID=A0A0B0MM90_GOSAR|nr:Tissue alpha-L-fucosidase [Gossypium arboreum]